VIELLDVTPAAEEGWWLLVGGQMMYLLALIHRDLEEEPPRADRISHRFSRPADPGPGRVVFDVLAPEGLGERRSILTVPSGRTVEAPGATQAFDRSELVDARWPDCPIAAGEKGAFGGPACSGAGRQSRRGDRDSVRQNPGRDWQDAALLLTLITDPVAVTQELTAKDRKRLARLRPLLHREHTGWATFTADDHRLRH
jgi:hypothetical protein